MTDYLRDIRNAKSIEKIALYIRAQGCKLTPSLLFTYRGTEAHDAIRQYEYDAQAIEKCETLTQARRILKERGYV